MYRQQDETVSGNEDNRLYFLGETKAFNSEKSIGH